MKHGRVDANQAEIVDALRRVGARVHVTSDIGQGFPDLVVAYRGRVYLLEIKTGSGTLTPEQLEFHEVWCDVACIVRSVDEALRVIGVDYA